jgi:hypothetical protein
MKGYTPVYDAAAKMIGRHFYQNGVGFGRVVQVDLIWAHVARLTIRLNNGNLVCPVKPITI